LAWVALTSRHDFVYQITLYDRLCNCNFTDAFSNHSLNSCFTLPV
jgi:hypothetical protein